MTKEYLTKIFIIPSGMCHDSETIQHILKAWHLDFSEVEKIATQRKEVAESAGDFFPCLRASMQCVYLIIPGSDLWVA